MRVARRSCTLAVFLVAAFAAYANTAYAVVAQDRVLLAPVLIGGPIPDGAGWQKEFDQRLIDVVRKSQRLALPAQRRSAQAASGCTDVACARALVEKEGVDLLISARVLLGGDRPPSYRVSVLVFDRARDDLRSREASCPACSELQAGELLSNLSAQALEVAAQRGPTQPGPSQPGSPPPGPTPPIAAPSPAGPTPNLAPVAPQPPPAPRPSPLRPLGIALVSVGSAGLVASVVALAIKVAHNGEDACDASLPVGSPCLKGRDTTPGIITSAVTGAISLGLGVAGAVVLGRSRHTPRALALALAGRF